DSHHSPLSPLPPRRPPSSPLFPYTTLFRSEHALASRGTGHHGPARRVLPAAAAFRQRRGARALHAHRRDHLLPRPANLHGAGARSEEHTSELQSRENLVCRLLLAKKKQRQW